MKAPLVILATLALVGCSDGMQNSSFSPEDPAVERSSESGDLDCADASYEEAQSLIEDGDPHGLDRDGDGEACEANR